MAPPIDINRLRVPSGRTLGQFRKDAKAIKRTHRIPLSQALNSAIQEGGFSTVWQTLAQHAKAMATGTDDAPPALPDAENTLILNTFPGMNRLPLMCWEDAMARDHQVCDIVVDGTGNTLHFASMAAHLKNLKLGRDMYLFDLAEHVPHGHLFNIDADTLTHVVGAVTGNPGVDYSDVIGWLKGSSHDLSEEDLTRLQASKNLGLMRLIDETGRKGMKQNHIFNTNSTAIFHMGASPRCTEEYNSTVIDIMRMVELALIYKPSLRIRLTLISPSRRVAIPQDLIDILYAHDHVETLIYVDPELIDDDPNHWVSHAFKKADSALVLVDHKQFVPPHAACVTDQIIENANVTDNVVTGTLFSQGGLVDTRHRFVLRCAPEPGSPTKAHHADGSPIG